MSDDDDEKGSDESAKGELFEAIDHFKRAANILFDKATSDPKLKNATDEAERVIQKVGDAAEPLARQLAGEISKMTKRLSGSVQDAVDRPKKKAPPADDEVDDGESTSDDDDADE